MHRKKLFWQLFPSHMILAGLLVLSFLIFIPFTTKNFYFQEKFKILEKKTTVLEEIIYSYDPQNLQKFKSFCKKYHKLLSARITLISSNGILICDSTESKNKINYLDRYEIKESLKGRQGRANRFNDLLKEEFIYLSTPLSFKKLPLEFKDKKMILRVSSSVSFVREVLSKIYWQILIASIILILMAGIFSYWPSHKISLSLEKLKSYAENLSNSSKFTGSIHIRHDEAFEMKALAKAMNKMGRQLSDRFTTIEKQKNEMTAVFSSMKEGMLTIDIHAKVFHFNESFLDYFSLNPSLVFKGQDVVEIISDLELSDVILSVLEKEQDVETSVNLRDIHLDMSGRPLRGPDGSMMGAVFIFNDITDIRILEQHRKQFVGNVGHELRTPLTSIQGYVETLIEGKVEDKSIQNKFLETIQRQTVRLNTLIDDLLVLSQIEKETDDNSFELFEKPLGPIIDSVVELCEGKRAKKNIIVEHNCPDGLYIMMKPNLLEQAILNLVDNAIKYGPENSTVNINILLEDKTVKISVLDKGAGIPENHLPRLFERFYSVDKARSRALGGTGLGLAIVKHIVFMHGGTVDVKSKINEGAEFSIMLPFSGIKDNERV